MLTQQPGQVGGRAGGQVRRGLNQAQELRFIFGGQGLGVLGTPGFELHALEL